MSRRSTPEEGPSTGSLLRRRDFLALGSIGLVASTFGDFAWAQPLTTAALPMPVGYLETSETIRNLKRLTRAIRRPGLVERQEKRWGEPDPVVVPAAGLFSGDTDLVGRPLRIRIDGLYPPAALDRKLRNRLPFAVDLEAVFPPPEPAVSQEPLRTYLWGLRRRPGWNPSPPMSFTFPLDWQALPEFVMTVRPAQGQPMVMTTRFTLDEENGRPRLRRGVYLFGFVPGVWDWDLRLKDLGRVAPPELFSVLVTIDSELQPESPPDRRRRERQ
jgi:hypothetical protein